MSIVIISISSSGGRHGLISSDRQISRDHLLVWRSSSTERAPPSFCRLWCSFRTFLFNNLSSRGNTTVHTCGESWCSGLYSREKKHLPAAGPCGCFSCRPGINRKASKFKKLKSINRVDIWNCNLCYHRLPAHFYSTPTEGVSKDIVGNRGKRSLSSPPPSFFSLFYWILFDLKHGNVFGIYSPPGKWTTWEGIVKEIFSFSSP